MAQQSHVAPAFCKLYMSLWAHLHSWVSPCGPRHANTQPFPSTWLAARRRSRSRSPASGRYQDFKACTSWFGSAFGAMIQTWESFIQVLETRDHLLRPRSLIILTPQARLTPGQPGRRVEARAVVAKARGFQARQAWFQRPRHVHAA